LYNECTRIGKYKLLIDITKKDGDIPDWDRFQLGEYIAELFRAKVKIAIRASRTKINRFSETVAVNRMANIQLFAAIKPATKWLLADQAIS
jgi:hypothetical protein